MTGVQTCALPIYLPAVILGSVSVTAPPEASTSMILYAAEGAERVVLDETATTDGKAAAPARRSETAILVTILSSTDRTESALTELGIVSIAIFPPTCSLSSGLL